MNNKEITDKIRQLRILKGFSQEVMALELEISTRAYSKIERGESLLSVERLYSISNIIGISVCEILEFEANNIFNGNTAMQQASSLIAYNSKEVDLVKTLYEKLLKEKDEMIGFLKKRM